MKRFLMLFLSVLLLCTFLGCAEEEPAADSCPPTFSCADYDLSAVRSICLGSGMTGKSLYLTRQEDISAILAAVSPLTGTDPISSRGYYGWNYDLAFYAEAEPDEHDTPLLTLVAVDFDTQTYLISEAVYEEVEGVSYKAIYTADAETLRTLIAVCGTYLE